MDVVIAGENVAALLGNHVVKRSSKPMPTLSLVLKNASTTFSTSSADRLLLATPTP